MDRHSKRKILRSVEMWKRKKEQTGFGIYLLTFLTVAIWLIGCTLIGYMAWVLATSVTVKQFLSGNLVFTYIIVGLGFLLFTIGLLGWVGATSNSSCILQMYIMASVLAIAFEVGGILSLNVLRLDMDDIVENGWSQVNQGTRNIVQNHFHCCGYTGPKEFAYRNDPIDDTCYEIIPIKSVEVAPSLNATEGERFLKQHGCGNKLLDWFKNNHDIWVSIIAGTGLLQILGCVSAIYVIITLRRLRKRMIDEMLEEAPNENGVYAS